MSTVALFVHGGRDDALQTGRLMAAWLLDHGHVPVADGTGPMELVGDGVEVDDRTQPVDLVIAIGGDGTMLRATKRAVEASAHVFGVNLGHLGYLADVEVGGWEAALERYFQGDFVITERLLVASQVWPPGGGPVNIPSGLNEVVIEKQDLSRTVQVAIAIDGQHFTTYVADGVIIATPTGSTAYSLSARGPVVAPTHRALLFTAVSPHSLFDRSLVLEPTSTVEVSILGDRAAAVAVDGEQIQALEPGSRVTVTSDERPARFVTFSDRNFHQILKAKFGLNTR
ncbi:MAG: NAD(+)/NADH kinase [Aquihabitans sp.]